MFELLIGINEFNEENFSIIERKAARAVIFNGDSILMILTNKGDYKFPGGGIKKEEQIENGLKREVEEESGYNISNVVKRIGIITEQNKDMYDDNSIFKMISYYYHCQVTSEKKIQKLDDYEREQDFTPVWVKIDEAINNNEKLLNTCNNDMNSWIYRETIALKEINKRYY